MTRVGRLNPSGFLTHTIWQPNLCLGRFSVDAARRKGLELGCVVCVVKRNVEGSRQDRREAGIEVRQRHDVFVRLKPQHTACNPGFVAFTWSTVPLWPLTRDMPVVSDVLVVMEGSRGLATTSGI